MSNNDSIILEFQSFPMIIWSKYLFSKNYIYFFSYEIYRKRSFRNRFVVSGSNGLIHLSVPLINRRNQDTPFKDIQICYREKWQVRYWRTIMSCYNRSPYFEFYRCELEKFFMNNWKFLFDWNLSVLEWLKQVLKFSGQLIITTQLSNRI